MRVHVHTDVHLPALLPSYTFSRVNLTPAQPEVEHGEHQTVCGQRHQETTRLLTRIFSEGKAVARVPRSSGTEELSCSPQTSPEASYGPQLLHCFIKSLSDVRLYFWKMETGGMDSF